MTAQTPERGRAAPPPTRQDRDAAVAAIKKLQEVARNVNRSLITLGVGTLVFTCINVTLFGMSHGIPGWVAWLLDPLASLALITTLYVDGVLAEQGDYKAAGWPLVLRWTAGLSTWLMNCWTSLYPTGNVTLIPHGADPGGLLLHSVAPVLLITLAEGASGYRRTIATKLREHREVIARYDAEQHRVREEREREAREERERAEREAREVREREARRQEIEAERRAEIEAKREAAEIERANREHAERMEAERAKREAAAEAARLRAEAEARAIEEEAQAKAEIQRREAEEREREREEKRRAAAQRRASQSDRARASQNGAAASQSGQPDPSENGAAPSESDRGRASQSGVLASESGRACASVSVLAPSESEGRVPRSLRQQQREDAEKWVAARLAEGNEPTAAEVGERYGKGETWGGDRVRAVKSRPKNEETEQPLASVSG
ncbi:hypothetical protein [Streptomyces sp. NPDC007063]|uniref:hypothetical protein n=1 Tax=Streptomyces sp. NPDC007063 TaxID=3364772 RepID=UPI00367B31F8